MKRKHLHKITTLACGMSLLFASGPFLIQDIQESGIMITASAAAHTYQFQNATYTYVVSTSGPEKTATLSTVSTNAATVLIPSSISVEGEQIKVTEIRDSFLSGNQSVETIVMPDSITKIGSSFANDCKKLKALTLSKGIKEIGILFCNHCTSLSTVYYSGTDLEKIGECPFQSTEFIKKFNDKGAVTLGDWVIKYDAARTTTDINISSIGTSTKIKKVGPRAFALAYNIQRLNLNGVTHVSRLAFDLCKNMHTVTNGNSLVYVEREAFNCTKWQNTLKQKGSVILGKILIKYVHPANSTTIDLSSNQYQDVRYFADGAFDCKGITKLIIRSNTENIYSISTAITNTLKDVYVYDVSTGKQTNLLNSAKNNAFTTAEQNFLNHNFASLQNTPFADGDNGIVLLLSKWHLQKCGVKYVGSPNNSNYSAWDQYLIAKKIYKYIGKNVSYKFAELGGSGNYKVEIVTHKGCVCNDYAELYKYWLGLAGIKSEKVTYSGDFLNAGHAWNIIQIGNAWFNADSCWNSGSLMFMTSDKTIGAVFAHKRSSDSYAKCTTEMGDVNGDHKINSIDASLVLSAYSDLSTGKPLSITPQQRVLADVNYDGYVNASDASLILGYYSAISTGYQYSLQQYIAENGIVY